MSSDSEPHPTATECFEALLRHAQVGVSPGERLLKECERALKELDRGRSKRAVKLVVAP